jgi:cytosine/adenosine deaminase-related metal-dependent hydrolase
VAETDTAIAHCPASNLFLASGAMPLARYLGAGIRVGLGSDVAAGPELSIFANMRAGAYIQSGLRVRDGEPAAPVLGPLDWLRLGTLAGARALGQEDAIGSLEAGKEADLIAVDPRIVAPVPGVDSDDPAEVMSRLAFRPHPDMVRAAWVRGRRLDGPPGIG